LRVLNEANEAVWSALEGETIVADTTPTVNIEDLLSEDDGEDDDDDEIRIHKPAPAPERRLSPRENRRPPDFYQA